MSYSSHEGRILEIFAHFGMTQKGSSKEHEDPLIDVAQTIPKNRLLKDISQLSDSFLAMQSLAPTKAVNYLSFVTGTLFELVSHPDPDVRMAADEGINQIVKLANIHLVQHVICEVFLEINRSLHARSLSSALRKFSASIGRINPKKRRIYAVNMLPALNGLIKREEEMVWECFAETIEPIAIFIFPHTSQNELITLLLRGLLEKVESDKNYIRRSAATILASSVVHSRLPHELSYLLIQQIIGRVFVLKHRFLARESTLSSRSSAALQGCLWTLRNLASLYSRIPTTTLLNGGAKSSGRPAATTYLSAPLVAMELANADFSTWSRESLEFFWWSVIRLICLHLACRNYQSSSTSASSTVMVCTAALECLLEILSSTPAGCPPTELPEGFQQALQAFCVAKTLPSASMALHLDDYDSSVDASDADDGSSVTSQSVVPSTSAIVEGGDGEQISIIKRSLLPSDPALSSTEHEPAEILDRQSIQGDESEFAESEEDNEIFAISSMHCCLGLFAERFGLLPGSKLTARASAQSLAVACLAKLTLTLPPDVFFEPLQIDDNEDVTTGIELALQLVHHTDPQVRGNACLLVGNLLHSTAAHALVQPAPKFDSNRHMQICHLISSLDNLLATEKSGIAYRMALKAVRCCANTILHLPALLLDTPTNEEVETAAVRLLRCLANRFVACARHPYRLVRREFLLLVASLDWDQLEHLERTWFDYRNRGSFTRLVAATPLANLAWTECLRLFADADRSLGSDAFDALLSLAKRTPSVDVQGSRMDNVHLDAIDAKATRLFVHSALTGHDIDSCELPLIQNDSTSGFADELRCVVKDLLTDLRFSALPPHSNQSTKSAKHRSQRLWRQWRQQEVRGTHRLFRELVDCLFELSPVCDTPENRSMMLALISGLGELLSSPRITKYHHLWYSPSPYPRTPQGSAEDSDTSFARFALQANQRRPKMALLLWHCISQLAVSSLALSDLSLQAQLLRLASGCALRWGLSSLLEGSIPPGGSMKLHPDHAFTRASGALLTHVIRLLAIFWHVFKGVKPNSALTASSILSGLVGVNSDAVPIASAPIGGPSTITTTTSTSQVKSKPIFGFQFIQTTEVEEENRLIIGSRETRGFFADSVEYMQLYNSIRASFEAFKHGSESVLLLLCKVDGLLTEKYRFLNLFVFLYLILF